MTLKELLKELNSLDIENMEIVMYVGQLEIGMVM